MKELEQLSQKIEEMIKAHRQLRGKCQQLKEENAKLNQTFKFIEKDKQEVYRIKKEHELFQQNKQKVRGKIEHLLARVDEMGI